MHAAVKVIVGFILLLVGLGMFVDSVTPSLRQALRLPAHFMKIDWIGNFITVLTGIIPIFLILIGLFVVWLELDEVKMEKELKAESKKEEEKKEEKKK